MGEVEMGTKKELEQEIAKLKEEKVGKIMSLTELKQTIQKLKENAKTIDYWLNSYTIEYLQDMGSLIFIKDLDEIVACVDNLQKQLQKVAKDKFCQDCHEHGRIQACHFCLYEILGEEKP